jgi:hypothetical protein
MPAFERSHDRGTHKDWPAAPADRRNEALTAIHKSASLQLEIYRLPDTSTTVLKAIRLESLIDVESLRCLLYSAPLLGCGALSLIATFPHPSSARHPLLRVNTPLREVTAFSESFSLVSVRNSRDPTLFIGKRVRNFNAIVEPTKGWNPRASPFRPPL